MGSDKRAPNGDDGGSRSRSDALTGSPFNLAYDYDALQSPQHIHPSLLNIIQSESPMAMHAVSPVTP